MVSGVGVADAGRVLPRLPRHGQTVRRMVARRGARARRAAAAGDRRAVRLLVAAEHERVEVEADLADGGVHLGHLVGAGAGGGVGGGEGGVLDVGDVLGDGGAAVTGLVDAANCTKIRFTFLSLFCITVLSIRHQNQARM